MLFVDSSFWIAWVTARDDLHEEALRLALMRSLRIREALAFDADFTAAGFVELRA